ncbi:hypothetical protein RHMOL_Rhmol11G0114900 [Rhododendron molle]|uniref:Uncharacterized protein n=1 Tax=Rhododendron molle TaxID=49168 RepID=A0ACC0LSP6_RHOML|nr:hypothetical protein RHMOL_Rhmol11G0114900 [Rhododendron molle]
MASTAKKILFFTPPPVFLSPPNFLRHAPETTFCGLPLRRNCSKVRISLTGLFVMPFSSSSHLLRYFSLRRTPETTFRGLPTSSGKVYGSLARAGKVRGQTPKVANRTRRRNQVLGLTSACSMTAALLPPFFRNSSVCYAWLVLMFFPFFISVACLLFPLLDFCCMLDAKESICYRLSKTETNYISRWKALQGKDFSKLNRDASRILYVSGHTLESSLQPENVFLSSRGSLKQMILRSWILFHSSSDSNSSDSNLEVNTIAIDVPGDFSLNGGLSFRFGMIAISSCFTFGISRTSFKKLIWVHLRNLCPWILRQFTDKQLYNQNLDWVVQVDYQTLGNESIML